MAAAAVAEDWETWREEMLKQVWEEETETEGDEERGIGEVGGEVARAVIQAVSGGSQEEEEEEEVQKEAREAGVWCLHFLISDDVDYSDCCCSWSGCLKAQRRLPSQHLSSSPPDPF